MWRYCSTLILSLGWSVLLLPLTYPLELILQNTGDVKAEVGAKCQQTVEEQHHKAVIHCKHSTKNGSLVIPVYFNLRV